MYVSIYVLRRIIIINNYEKKYYVPNILLFIKILSYLWFMSYHWHNISIKYSCIKFVGWFCRALINSQWIVFKIDENPLIHSSTELLDRCIDQHFKHIFW